MNPDQTNRPKVNAISQQQLKGWKPLMRFKDASIFFIILGIVTLAIGAAILLADQSLHQYVFNYTNCNSTCSHLANVSSLNCSCTIDVKINVSIPGPVYFYYGLTSFYQSHRQFSQSLDMNQLMGKLTKPDNSCKPVLQDESLKYYAPCGQMANAIFNDTFSIRWMNDNGSVPWTSKGIAMTSDLRRYGNPKNWSNTVKPPNWPVPIQQNYPNGYADDQELMVWMRPAAFPTFWKLHRIFNTTGKYSQGLPSGDYVISINYNYPVAIFGGEKLFIITNASWMGGRSFAMAILYLIVGIVEVLAGMIFIPLHYRDLMHKAKQNIYRLSPRL